MLAGISRFLLWFMGWRQLSGDTRVTFNSKSRAVVIYPHTSYWDYFLFILYRWANMDVFGEFHTLFAVRFFPLWGWFLSRTNSVAVENKSRHQGQTETLVNKFKDMKSFKLFLSPKGTSSKASWRTGYYYLAKQLDCPIIVAGLDYKNHRVIAFDPIDIYNDPIDIYKYKMIKLFSEIPPLYPKNDPDVYVQNLNRSKQRCTSILSSEALENIVFLSVVLLTLTIIAFVTRYIK